MLMRRLAEPAPRLRSVVPEISPALDQVVAHALERLPQDRFDSAEALAQALAAASTTAQARERDGRVWSALRAQLSSLAGFKARGPWGGRAAGVAPPPSTAASANAAGGRSPALGQPRIGWPGDAGASAPDPQASPQGTSSQPDGGAAVAAPGAQPSPPAPWRIMSTNPQRRRGQWAPSHRRPRPPFGPGRSRASPWPRSSPAGGSWWDSCSSPPMETRRPRRPSTVGR